MLVAGSTLSVRLEFLVGGRCMSDDQDKASKTEEPTAKRLSDALEEGNVPMSREAAVFSSLIGIFLVSALLIDAGAAHVTGGLRHLIDRADQFKLESGQDVQALAGVVLLDTLWLLAPAVLVLMLFGLIGSLVQTSPKMIPKRIMPELSRLSPLKGFVKLFGARGWFEFLKAILKFSILGVVCTLIWLNSASDVLMMVFSDPGAHFGLVHSLIDSVIFGLLIAFSLLVAADVMFSRHVWHRELFMTKQQVKDEQKQQEGDPIVKGRMRSMIRDLARRRMIERVPRATMVIVNPTHYAVALRYVKGESSAPLVLAKGKDHIALRIKELAKEADIPIIEDRVLARSLYDAVRVDQLIEPAFYEAIASIILMLARKSRPNQQVRVG